MKFHSTRCLTFYSSKWNTIFGGQKLNMHVLKIANYTGNAKRTRISHWDVITWPRKITDPFLLFESWCRISFEILYGIGKVFWELKCKFITYHFLLWNCLHKSITILPHHRFPINLLQFLITSSRKISRITLTNNFIAAKRPWVSLDVFTFVENFLT